MMEIISREYGTGETGFAALAADLKTMLDWSEVDESTDGQATFKLYNADDGSRWAGLRVFAKEGSAPTIDPMSCNGAATYKVAVLPTGFYFKYVNYAVWDGGFCAHATDASALPCYSNSSFVNFGAARGKMDGTEGWCSWGFAPGKSFIGSDDTTSASAGGYDYAYWSKLTCAIPLVYPYSRYVVDGVLKLSMTQDTYMNNAGFCTWNGRRYYKNGCMMIPAE